MTEPTITASTITTMEVPVQTFVVVLDSAFVVIIIIRIIFVVLIVIEIPIVISF